MTSILTVTCLVAAIACTIAGITKLVALRKKKDLSLKTTAWTILIAGSLFWLTLPAVYHAVGKAFHSPSLATLLIDTATLLSTATAHLLTQLWHPLRREPKRLRRTLLTWVPLYAGTLTAMAVLFFSANLQGPAYPLQFVVAYGHVPQVFAMQTVFLVSLTITTIVVALQLRGLTTPGTPLDQSVKMFALAVYLDVPRAVCTFLALVSASSGFDRLNFLAELVWIFPCASALTASYGLVSYALAVRRAEKRDADILEVLRAHLILVEAPALDTEDETATTVTSVGQRLRAWWQRLLAWGQWLWYKAWGWDVRWRLLRLLTEIRDGEDNLAPWMSPCPARQVADVVATLKDHLAHGDPMDLSVPQQRPGRLREDTLDAVPSDMSLSEVSTSATGAVQAGTDGVDVPVTALAAQLALDPVTVAYLLSEDLREDQVVAMQAAATILHAAVSRAAGVDPVPEDQEIDVIPGQDVPAPRERSHLISVAEQLEKNPLVHHLVRNLLTEQLKEDPDVHRFAQSLLPAGPVTASGASRAPRGMPGRVR